ncbi:MAG: diadenylate cyclase CdaA [Candidatus Omnitrophica bacterium]|jgi:diadenylate cyclase|nr:diadenylate cyclase CdaA [Candidatus Omnitrophota bacterium]
MEFLNWQMILEILILWFIIYSIILFFYGTRAIQVLRGIVLIMFAFFVFQKLNLQVVDWIFTKLFAISVIAILIIFHPEIRHGLARLGQQHLFGATLRDEDVDSMLDQVMTACENLARNKYGALIALEIKDPLANYVEKGITIDGKISAELIESIFTPKSILHDGGIIIQHGKISAAGCIFPLSESSNLNRIFGTRHRAAIGLSEETDAIIIVVSEERNDISLVYNGKMHKDLSRESIFTLVKEILKQKYAQD